MRFTRNLRWPATEIEAVWLLTFHVSRFTFHVSRFTFHVSRFTFHVSRFTFHLFERNAMSENKRQQRVVERILEDERLRGDLEDTAATALVHWATAQAEAAAADPTRPDDAVE